MIHLKNQRLAADRENMVDLFTTWIPPRFSDAYDPKPGAARASTGIHTVSMRKNQVYGYCSDGMEVRPAAIYTKKYKMQGERAFRERGLWKMN